MAGKAVAELIYFFIHCLDWKFVGLAFNGKLCGLIMPDFETKRLPLLTSTPCLKHLRRHLGKITLKEEHPPLAALCQKELTQYFRQKLTQFSVPLVLIGTPFQRTVWQALLNIPYGQTLTYKALAQHLSKPTGFRAVAQACRANPLPVFIPCHRVIGKQGLTGYSSGLKWKQYLLDLEGAYW